MKIKFYKLFFNICLFIFVGTSCLKQLSIDVIKEAFIGNAFAFRINEVISDACPEMNINEAIELQVLMQKHPQLDKVIHNYLCVYDDYLNGKNEALEQLDHEKQFQHMNQNILKEIKKRNPSSAMTMSDDEFLAKIRMAETEVENILSDRIPGYLENYGKMALWAIEQYAFFTSAWTQLGLIMMILLTVLFVALDSSQSSHTLLYSFGKIFIVHGGFWAVIISSFIKIAGRMLLDIVDRILGRSMFLEGTVFLWHGIGLLIVGLIFVFVSKHNHSAIEVLKEKQV